MVGEGVRDAQGRHLGAARIAGKAGAGKGRHCCLDLAWLCRQRDIYIRCVIVVNSRGLVVAVSEGVLLHVDHDRRGILWANSSRIYQSNSPKDPPSTAPSPHVITLTEISEEKWAT